MKTELTTTNVRNLAPAKPGKNYMVYDTVERGFAVRVTATGSKTFLLCYSAGGKERRHAFATFPGLPVKEARKRAGVMRSQIKGGADPAGDKQQARVQSAREMDFAALATRYIAEHAKLKKRSWAEDERRLNNFVLPVWGKRKAKDISRADVVELVTPVAMGDADKGINPRPAEANHRLALVRKVFSFAVDRGIIDHHPCLRMSAPGGKIAPRTRALTTARELRVFWRITSGEGVWGRIIRKTQADALRFVILTGCRSSEATELAWAEIDLHERLWKLPAHRSKNKREHWLPLTDPLVDLLSARQNPEQSHVFKPRLKTFMVDENLSRPLREACRRLARIGIEPFTTHDLRRTVETGMAASKVPKEYRDRVLNHVDGSVGGVHYNQYDYLDDKREALEKWQARLESMLKGATSNVVQFRKAG